MANESEARLNIFLFNAFHTEPAVALTPLASKLLALLVLRREGAVTADFLAETLHIGGNVPSSNAMNKLINKRLRPPLDPILGDDCFGSYWQLDLKHIWADTMAVEEAIKTGTPQDLEYARSLCRGGLLTPWANDLWARQESLRWKDVQQGKIDGQMSRPARQDNPARTRAYALLRDALDGIYPDNRFPSRANYVSSDTSTAKQETLVSPEPIVFGQPAHEANAPFIRLALTVGPGAGSTNGPPDRPFEDLDAVLDVTRQHPALVLLGAPGSGKSTLLRRAGYLAREAWLRGETHTAPFLVSLADYKPDLADQPLPEPLEWLESRWSVLNPTQLSLKDLLAAGRVLLLLDELNQIPHQRTEEYWDRIGLWGRFVAQSIRTVKGNRAVFACRTLDYSMTLSCDGMVVPEVNVQPLDNARIIEFLRAYLPPEADIAETWRGLQHAGSLISLFRVPFYLKMVTDLIASGGRAPDGRAKLFAGFVRGRLRREAETSAWLTTSGLLTFHDRTRLFAATAAQRYPTLLPDGGDFVPCLTALAYRMLARRGDAPPNDLKPNDLKPNDLKPNDLQIRSQQAVQLLQPEYGKEVVENVIRAGCTMGLLDRPFDSDAVRFSHQLLLEFFAARQLATETNLDPMQVPWRIGDCSPALGDVIGKLTQYESLPPLPGTGWEETAVIAASLTRDPDAFIRLLLARNLPLAARCAAQPDVCIAESLQTEIRTALIARTRDRAADIRARLSAGLALGLIGDPRFTRRAGPHGAYLLPPMVPIPAKNYPIGSDRSKNEKPTHEVPVVPFLIGVFPVTNAEYELFIAAGGYEDERWWESAAARAWHAGERRARSGLRESSGQALSVRLVIDEAFQNPLQPVVGVCWHEARAYCAWLSAQTGSAYRLPAEVEFEAAASGLDSRDHADMAPFDGIRCNTAESHIRRSTPVGIFDNATPEGVYDLSGNVWEWMSSLYHPYPYDAMDGRECPDAEGGRVMRGGSWKLSRHVARATARGNYPPTARYNDFGFRLALTVYNVLST